MTMSKENHKDDGRSFIRRFVIVVVLLVFATAAVFLVRSVLLRQRAGVHTKQNAAASSAQAGQLLLNGTYTLRAYTLSGKEYAAEETEKDWYLVFNGDGIGYACIMDQQPCAFRYTDQELRLDDGSVYPYQAAEDVLTLYGSAVMVFAKGDPLETQASFQLGHSTWHGTLKISKHSGKGSLANGEWPVWGIIHSDSDGNSYFELYDKEFYTIEDIPVLSMWVRVYDDHIEPVSGQTDAWYFDLPLTGDTLNVFTLYLKDDSLSRSFWYTCGKEHCNIYFEIYPDT